MKPVSYWVVLRFVSAIILIIVAAQAAPGMESYSFGREICLAPGEFYAVHYDADRREFVSDEPRRGYEGLSRATQRQILRAPLWLREMLADRLVDLYYDDIDVGENAAPTFFDVNDDNRADLVVGNAAGEIRCFLAPFFKEDKELFQRVRVAGNAAPCFYDLDRDGRAELYLGDSHGGLTVWEGKSWETRRSLENLPFTGQVHPVNFPSQGLVIGDESGQAWRADKKERFHLLKEVKSGDNGSLSPYLEAYGTRICLRGSKNGELSLGAEGELPCENRFNLQSPAVAGNACPVFQDVNGDNLPDLVLGAADGSLDVFINRGQQNAPWFAVYPRESVKKFPFDVGYLSSPRVADIDGDGSPDVVTGAKDGVVRIFKGPKFNEMSELSDSLRFPGSVIPAPGDFDSDGRVDLVCGLEDGTILLCSGLEFTQKRAVGKVESYAAPYAADIDMDGRCDLVVGVGDGSIVLFLNSGNGFEERPDFFGEIKAGDYPCPAVMDVNGDGDLDLVAGSQAGPLKVFLAPDWIELPEGLELGTKETFTTPEFGDLTGDGKPELVLGGLAGTFLYYEKEEGGWVEKQSWQFESSVGLSKVTDYFCRCHRESEPLRGMNDLNNIEAFTAVLAQAEDRFFDETAFALAAMPTEVLRALGRVGNADVLLENARCIYEMADKVNYARIVEKPDYTTIEYVCEDGAHSEMPREVYYWWLVHPRLYYEVPLRIDPSYWEHDSLYYGVTYEQWTRKEIDLENIGTGAHCEFWRSYFLHDKKYGKTLLDVIQPAKTVEEAIYLMGDWISQSMPDSWYVYGRKSADSQPQVIYQKAYGSCGESAILGAAFHRTMLVASGCAGCEGEDHVWNEFWLKDKWFAWDLGQPSNNIRYPWHCCEGPEHRGTQTIAVTRPRGDDLLESRTIDIDQPEGCNSTASGKGYTETAPVTIQVVDADGCPVEGAAVIVRSDCRDYWRTAIWGYTDPQGYCCFDLGKPQKRCMFDVIAQQGLTGTSHLPLEENRAYFLKYMLPGKFNAPLISWIDAASKVEIGDEIGSVKIETRILEEVQHPPNLASSRRPREDLSEFMKKTSYTGTRWAPCPNLKHYGVAFAQMNREEFERFRQTHRLSEASRLVDTSLTASFTPDVGDVYLFYNPNRFTGVRFSAAITASAPSAPPLIQLLSADEEARTGERLHFIGAASDNLHLAALTFSPDHGDHWTNITDCLDRENGTFDYTWNTAEGGPLSPGIYGILFRAEDDAGAAAQTQPVAVTLNPAREFKNQVIFQDNPDSPLPKSSWILGPFMVNRNERFLGITTTSEDPGFDLDLFLFHDKNGNRRLDGLEEKQMESTSPGAAEKIVLSAPPTGVYWIYGQGWQVKEREKSANSQPAPAELPPGQFLSMKVEDLSKKTTFALTDISLSFDYQPAFITDVSPTGSTPLDEVVLKGLFDPACDVDTSTVRLLLDGIDLTDELEVNRQGFELNLGNRAANDHEYEVQVEAKTQQGLADCAAWKFKPVYVPLNVQATPVEDEKSVNVQVACRQDHRLEGARACFSSVKNQKRGEWLKLKLSDDAKSASGSLSTIGYDAGIYEVLLEYRIQGQKPDSTRGSFKLERGAPLPKKLVVQPSPNSEIYDFRPVLAGFAVGEIREKVKSLKLILDRVDITDRCKNYGSGIKFLSDADLALGEHLLTCSMTLKDGSSVEEKSTFIVKVMGKGGAESE